MLTNPKIETSLNESKELGETRFDKIQKTMELLESTRKNVIGATNILQNSKTRGVNLRGALNDQRATYLDWLREQEDVVKTFFNDTLLGLMVAQRELVAMLVTGQKDIEQICPQTGHFKIVSIPLTIKDRQTIIESMKTLSEQGQTFIGHIPNSIGIDSGSNPSGQVQVNFGNMNPIESVGPELAKWQKDIIGIDKDDTGSKITANTFSSSNAREPIPVFDATSGDDATPVTPISKFINDIK